MKSFGVKPWMMPQPVLIIGTYNEDGTPNAMNAAWRNQYFPDVVKILREYGHEVYDFRNHKGNSYY